MLDEKYASSIRSSIGPYEGTSAPPWASAVERYRSRSPLESMAFFHDALANFPIDEGMLLVGTFCNIVPDEVILACGALPVRLCNGDSACARAGDQLTPGDVCPGLKASAGGLITAWSSRIDLLIVPAACDGKAKLGELLAPFTEVYFLDIPRDSDYLRSADAWERQFNSLYHFLRKRYGRKADRAALIKACREVNERTSAFRAIFEARGRTPGLITSFDYFTMANASFLIPPGRFSLKATRVLDEARERLTESSIREAVWPPARPGQCETDEPQRFIGKRLLLSGSPVLFPHFKLLHILDEAGADVAADTLCCAYGRMYDPVQLDEETQTGIIRAVALKHVAASMCPCFLGVGKLLDRIIELVREFRLDGVIYHILRLCQVFEIQSAVLRQALKEEGIPLLCIQTDFGVEDTGQLKTRIEAFLEMMG
jgi:benzoyl-CoA reductase/2-hydroxyglutaryl-CoA dehydratase subunit BcrC/BadD/HgdB